MAYDEPEMQQDGAKAGGKGGALGVIVASVLALALGGAHGFFIDKLPIAKKEATAEAGKAEAAKPAASLGVLRDLAPIVTNLAKPSDAWVRFEGGIIVEAAAAKQSDVLAGQIGSDILAYLRTVTASQLQGANGLTYLREDINERARQRSEGKVREVVIQTLVVQ